MSFNFSEVKWSWVIIGAVVGFVVALVLTLVVNVGYGVVLGFQMRGAPPQDVLYAALSSLPFAILGLVWTLIGGMVGGRMSGSHSEEVPQLAGLLAGILIAAGLAVLQRDLSVWGAAHVVLAVISGWLGGWLAGRTTGSGYDELYV